MIGFAALALALVFTLITVFVFFRAARVGGPAAGKDRQEKAKGIYYKLSVALILVAALYLWFLILSDQFQYRYVYAYSARDLALFYKIAAFWAGQEGSFLLWLAFHGLLGLVLLRRKENQGAVLAVYALLQAGLLIVLLVQSPFMMLAPVPDEGMGLNPLLQNPWMVSHPPVLFLGYACLAVPFALAIASLLAHDYKSWLKRALPWALLAWAALGLGIFMGGYWAYKVLGWGGYWAWDPVENSSLIPWLIAGSFIHFLVVARRRPMAVKPAYLTAILAYVAALYGTFLTRSGILSDFSTHSFANQGIGGVLSALMMLVLGAALVVLIVEWPSLPKGEGEEQIKSREFMTAVGAIALAAFALLVLLGTSSPLITSLLGSPQSVNASFYNTTSLPLVACILLLMALAGLFKWGKAEVRLSPKTLLILLPGVAALALGPVLGIGKVMAVLVLGLAGLALGASVLGWKNGLSKPAVFTHVGVSVLVIGIICSSAASRTEIVYLEPGEAQTVWGKTVSYEGQVALADEQGYVQKFTLDGRELEALTRYDKAGRFSVHEPAIHRGLWSDVYLAPSLEQPGERHDYELAKGQPVEIEGEGLVIALQAYGMSSEDPETTGVYALLDVEKGGEIEEVKVELLKSDGVFSPAASTVFDQYELNLLAVSVSKGAILLNVANLAEPADRISLEFSEKPLINFVWLGTLIISLGTFWASFKSRGPRPF